MTEPEVIIGRGAWTDTGRLSGRRTYMYVEGTPKDGATPELGLNYLAVWFGVKAIQMRTNEILSDLNPIPEEGLFGPATSARVRLAQVRLELEETIGEFGRTTAKAYWKPVVKEYADKHEVPAELLWGQMMLESAADPGAVVKSSRPYDLGLEQINVQAHKSITPAMAFDYRFALNWGASKFAGAMKKYASKPELQMEAAVLAHNTPVGADNYFETGTLTEKGQNYIGWVMSRAETY